MLSNRVLLFFFLIIYSVCVESNVNETVQPTEVSEQPKRNEQVTNEPNEFGSTKPKRRMQLVLPFPTNPDNTLRISDTSAQVLSAKAHAAPRRRSPIQPVSRPDVRAAEERYQYDLNYRPNFSTPQSFPSRTIHDDEPDSPGRLTSRDLFSRMQSLETRRNLLQVEVENEIPIRRELQQRMPVVTDVSSVSTFSPTSNSLRGNNRDIAAGSLTQLSSTPVVPQALPQQLTSNAAFANLERRTARLPGRVQQTIPSNFINRVNENALNRARQSASQSLSPAPRPAQTVSRYQPVLTPLNSFHYGYPGI